MGLVLALSLITPTFADTPPATPTPPVSVEDTCFDPYEVIQAFGQIAEESGDELALVHQKVFEDNSSVLVFWKGGETVLVLVFVDGCYDSSEEITLAEFRDITGIVLSDS